MIGKICVQHYTNIEEKNGEQRRWKEKKDCVRQVETFDCAQELFGWTDSRKRFLVWRWMQQKVYSMVLI